MEKEYRYANEAEYREALQHPPSKGMIKERKLGGDRVTKYIPIHTQEAIADMLFKEWNIIDESYVVIVNEVIATVKIQYLPDYPGADYMFCTGSGANVIQSKSGSKAEDFPIGKITNSLEYCLPAARSNAKSNALEELGNLFGRNVSRNVDNGYRIAIKKEEEKKDA